MDETCRKRLILYLIEKFVLISKGCEHCVCSPFLLERQEAGVDFRFSIDDLRFLRT